MPMRDSEGKIIDLSVADYSDVDDVWNVKKGRIWVVKNGEIFSPDFTTKMGYRKIQMPNILALHLRECARGKDIEERKMCFIQTSKFRHMKERKRKGIYDNLRKDYVEELVDTYSEKDDETKTRMKSEILESYYDIKYERR